MLIKLIKLMECKSCLVKGECVYCTGLITVEPGLTGLILEQKLKYLSDRQSFILSKLLINYGPSFS